VGQAASQIALGQAQIRPAGQLLGHLVGGSSGNDALGRRFSGAVRAGIGRPTPAELARLAVRFRKFPLYLAPADLINATGRNLPTMLLGILYGAPAAGALFLAERVIGLPLAVVGQAVSQVLFAESGELARRDPRELRRLVLTLAGNLALAALIPAALLFGLGETCFVFVFGEGWRTSGALASALALLFVARFVVSPLGVTLTVLERQPWLLAVQTALATISAGVLVAGWLGGLDPVAVVRLYAGVTSLVYAAVFLVVLLALRAAVSAREGTGPVALGSPLRRSS
jgi:O-antigen/teichoic acid export membrane protein